VENTRTPNRRFALLAAVVLALGTLVSCGSGPVGQSVAATVEGRDIGVDQVTELVEAQMRYTEAQADNPELDNYFRPAGYIVGSKDDRAGGIPAYGAKAVIKGAGDGPMREQLAEIEAEAEAPATTAAAKKAAAK
jgi:hypothetical protein